MVVVVLVDGWGAREQDNRLLLTAIKIVKERFFPFHADAQN